MSDMLWHTKIPARSLTPILMRCSGNITMISWGDTHWRVMGSGDDPEVLAEYSPEDLEEMADDFSAEFLALGALL